MMEYSEPRSMGRMPVDVWGSDAPPLACMVPTPVFIGRDLRAGHVYITACEDDGPLGVCINIPVDRLRDVVDALTDILEGDSEGAVS